MNDGWGFLVYLLVIPTIIGCIISFLLLTFFIKFQSFCDFIASRYFWLAWFFPYYLSLTIFFNDCCYEQILVALSSIVAYIPIILLPLIYFARKILIANKIRKKSKFLLLWIIPVSVCSFFIHWGFYSLKFLFFEP